MASGSCMPLFASACMSDWKKRNDDWRDVCERLGQGGQTAERHAYVGELVHGIGRCFDVWSLLVHAVSDDSLNI